LCAALVVLAACDGNDDDEDPTPPASTATPATAPTPASEDTPGPDEAIVIDEPAAGDDVAVPVAMSGTANVFEAVLFVQALDAAGEVICERRVMASAGTGTVGVWDTTVAFPPPEEDTPITLRAFSRSPRDGAEENSVTREVTVVADTPEIVVEEPTCNQDFALDGSLIASGVARVFENSLIVELRDSEGAVLEMAVVTADAPDIGTFGDWETTIDLAGIPAGAYDLVAYSISAQDGSVENVFSVPVRITV
jgi:hypothetical protein